MDTGLVYRKQSKLFIKLVDHELKEVLRREIQGLKVYPVDRS